MANLEFQKYFHYQPKQTCNNVLYTLTLIAQKEVRKEAVGKEGKEGGREGGEGWRWGETR